MIGIQATGKSTFARERLYDTHVRINLDMLRTRNRERLLLDACIEAGQPFAVDNTNATAQERARYIEPAKSAGFAVVGYDFQSAIDEALQRNAGRSAARQVPEGGVRGTHARLEIPVLDEGFDALHYVRIEPGTERTNFHVEDWSE